MTALNLTPVGSRCGWNWKLHTDLKTTMIYLPTISGGMTLADKIVVLERVIQQAGSPLQLYNAPANRFVAGFIGSPSMNFLPAKARVAAGGLEVTLNGGAPLMLPARSVQDFAGDRSVTLGIRPEHLKIATADQAHLSGTVTVVEYLGNMTYVYVDTAHGPVIVESEEAVGSQPGQTLGLALTLGQTHVFDENGLAWARR